MSDQEPNDQNPTSAETINTQEQDRMSQPVDAEQPPRLPFPLVEDDSVTREALQMLLAQAGIKVTAVSSSSAALAEFEKSAPDMLISDIGLPEMDGYGLIAHIRRFESAHGMTPTPAIALTAYARETDRKMAIFAGYQQHISKPIEPDQLLGVLTRILQDVHEPEE